MPTSTRLSPRYREHLKALRTLAYKLESNAECNAFIDAIDALAFDMANKRPLTEEVEVETKPAGDEVVLEPEEESAA